MFVTCALYHLLQDGEFLIFLCFSLLGKQRCLESCDRIDYRIHVYTLQSSTDGKNEVYRWCKWESITMLFKEPGLAKDLYS